MTSVRKLFGDNVRSQRHKLGLSQGKLSEKVGSATNYIALIEGGKKFPSADMIERIAAALECDTPELFSIIPIQEQWQENLLGDIGKLISARLNELPPSRHPC